VDRATPADEGHADAGEIYAAEIGRQQAMVRAKGKSADRFAQKRRDDEIRALYASGEWTQEQLASRFNVSRVRVTQLVKKALETCDGRRAHEAADVHLHAG
jgi:DNA-directed RNA polymerase specialized sigma subunit